MSMTLEEAVERLKRLKRSCRDLAVSMPEEPGWALHGMALDMAISALRPVSREQVEKVWRGKWIDAHPGTSSCKCTKCGAVQEYESTFCCHCGAPMTDEAVEMVVKRMEVLNDAD
jgi:hypothetical protein